MKLILNGEEYEYAGAKTLPDLLRHIGADPERVAVMVNDEVIPAEQRGNAHLAPGCRIEVLTLAGGG